MDTNKEPTLLQKIEREVLAEGQEFMRKRMQERLQELADTQGEVSPPKRPAADPNPDRAHRAERRGRKD